MFKNKIKILSISVGMAIALMGAGYAQWGNNITHNTTLNTGSFSVVFEKDSLWGAEATDSNLVKVVEPTMKDMVDNDAGGHGRIVDFTFNNIYPGSTFTTKYEIRNRGTVPAKLTSIDVLMVNSDNTTTPIQTVASDPSAPEGLKELIKNISVTANFNKHIGSGDTNVALGGFTDVKLTNLKAEIEARLSTSNAILEPDTFIGLGLLQWLPTGAEVEPIHGFLFKVDHAMNNYAQSVKLPLRFVYNYEQAN